jgi:hypothetical protein
LDGGVIRLPRLTVEVHDDERPLLAEFNTSTYQTTDAPTLRAKAAYFISILRSHQGVLDELVEIGVKAEASGIRAEEKLNTR